EGGTDMRERVYRPGRGPRQCKGVGFWVSQARLLEQRNLRLGYHHFALRARGVTPCDTSHDVAPTPDFSGSDNETKAQASGTGPRAPYLMISWTDGPAAPRGGGIGREGGEQASEMRYERGRQTWP
ncbi:hypothetical protein THAOC_09452, partial [Thalassiosira oceanica]